MHRRTNKRSYSPDEVLNNAISLANDSFFSDNFRDVYNSMDRGLTSPFNKLNIPNILNFDLQPANTAQSIQPIQPIQSIQSIQPTQPTLPTPSIKPVQVVSEKKCGVKTLLGNSSKFIYPFEKSTVIPTESQTPVTNETEEAEEKIINEIIKTESLDQKENLIESQTDVSQQKLPTRNENENDTETDAVVIDIIDLESQPQKNIINIECKTHKENLSDIENRMVQKTNVKKNDIKTEDISIVSMNKQQSNFSENSVNTITEEYPKENIMESITTSPLSVPAPTSVQIERSRTEIPMVPEVKTSETKSIEPEVFVFPQLTIQDINTSFKVVGDLRDGTKLKIVNDRYLADDASYFTSLMRTYSGQSRDKIMSFLEHLHKETMRNSHELLFDIRQGNQVDNKLSELRDLYSNLFSFLHRYENMRSVYKNDSATFAKLGVIRNQFFTFKDNFFRELVIPNGK